MTFRFNTDHLQTTVQFVEPPNQFLHLRLVRPVKVLQRKRKERQERSHVAMGARSLLSNARYISFLSGSSTVTCVAVSQLSEPLATVSNATLPEETLEWPSSPHLQRGPLYARFEADLCHPTRKP